MVDRLSTSALISRTLGNLRPRETSLSFAEPCKAQHQAGITPRVSSGWEPAACRAALLRRTQVFSWKIECETTVPPCHKWGKPFLIMHEIKESYHPFSLVLVELHLFEPPVQGREFGQDPAGELLKHSGHRALLLWGELEGITLAGSEDDEVKTGPNSSPLCKGIKKGDEVKRFSLAAVIKAMSTSCHLEIRLSINKNFSTRGLEQATRQAVASPPLEVFKRAEAEPWLMQSSVGSSPVLRWRLDQRHSEVTSHKHFNKSMKSCEGYYGPDTGFSVHAPLSPSCSRQCPGLYLTCNALAHVGCPQLPTSWRDSW